MTMATLLTKSIAAGSTTTRKLAGSKRTIVKPGDEITLKGGVKITVVASEAKFIDKPINGGGPNPLCADAPQMTPAAGEN